MELRQSIMGATENLLLGSCAGFTGDKLDLNKFSASIMCHCFRFFACF
jgi:hypothetical protein